MMRCAKENSVQDKPWDPIQETPKENIPSSGAQRGMLGKVAEAGGPGAPTGAGQRGLGPRAFPSPRRPLGDLTACACKTGPLTLPVLSVTECFLGQDTAHAEFIALRCLLIQALLAGQDTGVPVPANLMRLWAPVTHL